MLRLYLVGRFSQSPRVVILEVYDRQVPITATISLPIRELERLRACDEVDSEVLGCRLSVNGIPGQWTEQRESHFSLIICFPKNGGGINELICDHEACS